MENYATIDELKVVMGSSWDDSQEALAERLLTVASAGIRKVFRNAHLNVNEMILSGETEPIVVSQVVCDMVARNLKQSFSPLGSDFSQMSQSAGGYSISVSTNGSNLYIKKDELSWLGIPSLSLSYISIYKGDENE